MNELKRVLGVPLLLFFGLGNILGAGIYVLIGKVAGEAGMYAPVAFMVASLVAGFSAFTYSELSARYPLSAGEAIYIEEGFHLNLLSRLTGLLIALAGMVSAATISRGFFGYFDVFVQWPEPLVIIAVIVILGALVIWGISESVSMAALLTVIEICGLMFIIYVGRGALAEVPVNIDLLLPPADGTVAAGIILGAFLAFFAFIGFEDMVNVAEEVVDPKRTLPLAILLALLIATLIYAAVSLVAVLSLDLDRLSSSTAPLADVVAATSTYDPRIIGAISLFAIINGALIQMIMASRIFYGMANRGWLWERLAEVNSRTRTPVNATLLVIGIVLTLALWIPLEALAKMTSFLVLCVFTLVNAALVMIKRRTPAPEGVINIPLWVPVAGALSSGSLILYQVVFG